MQRLGDIVAGDLNYIMYTFRDFTKAMVIQCGSYKETVMGSLQDDDVQFTSDVLPVNAFSCTLFFIESTNADFNKCLKKDSIIFVDGVSYKIIDSVLEMGLRILALERKGGR
jgi:hypothetical protein